MKTREKQLKLHKQIIDALNDFHGHNKFDYIIGTVNLDHKRNPSTVISNMTAKNLMGFYVQASEELAKQEGLE